MLFYRTPPHPPHCVRHLPPCGGKAFGRCASRLRASYCHAAAAHDAVISPYDCGKTQLRFQRALGFSHPLRVLCRCSPRLRASVITLRGLRDGRLPSDSDTKQNCSAILGFLSSLQSIRPAPGLSALLCHASAMRDAVLSGHIRNYASRLRRFAPLSACPLSPLPITPQRFCHNP